MEQPKEELPVESTTSEQASDDSDFAAALAAAGAFLGVEQADEPAPPQEAAAPREEAPPSPAPAQVAPDLYGLMQREAALIEREKALRAKEEELTPKETQLQRFAESFQYDPVSAIKQLVPNAELGEVARRLYYAELGPAAPPEFRADQEARIARSGTEQVRAEMKAEIEALKAQIAERDRTSQVQQYIGGLNKFVEQVPDELARVKAFAAADPKRAAAALLQIASAQETPLEPNEVAKLLDAELEVFAKAFQSQQAPPQARTLSNRHTTVQTPRVAHEELDDDALRERALQAAFAELNLK